MDSCTVVCTVSPGQVGALGHAGHHDDLAGGDARQVGSLAGDDQPARPVCSPPNSPSRSTSDPLTGRGVGDPGRRQRIALDVHGGLRGPPRAGVASRPATAGPGSAG